MNITRHLVAAILIVSWATAAHAVPLALIKKQAAAMAAGKHGANASSIGGAAARAAGGLNGTGTQSKANHH